MKLLPCKPCLLLADARFEHIHKTVQLFACPADNKAAVEMRAQLIRCWQACQCRHRGKLPFPEGEEIPREDVAEKMFLEIGVYGRRKFEDAAADRLAELSSMPLALRSSRRAMRVFRAVRLRGKPV